MTLRLDGKVAVITGACSGIGLATLELFIEEGARVLAADVQLDAGQALVQRFPGVLRFAPCDVTQPAQIKAAIDGAAEAFGGLCKIPHHVRIAADIRDGEGHTDFHGIHPWFGQTLSRGQTPAQGLHSAADVARESLLIASTIDIYTNDRITLEEV